MDNATQKTLKYLAIADQVRRGIEDGRFAPGQPIPTERELAKLFQTSRPTAGKAMKALEDQGLITRRQGAGTFVRQQARRQYRIGYIAPQNAQAEHFREVFDSFSTLLAAAAAPLQASVVLAETAPPRAETPLTDKAQWVRRCCDRMIQDGVDGVIFMPILLPSGADRINLDIYQAFCQADIPVVLFDRDLLTRPTALHCDLVKMNNFDAAFQLTELLISRGSRRIHFVHITDLTSSTWDRIHGYQAALLQHDLPTQANQIHMVDPNDTQSLDAVASRTDYDALVCVRDRLAAMLMARLHEFGRQVPELVRIVGFDNVPMSEYLLPSLTTVQQPVPAMAQAAMQAIINRINGSQLPPMQIQIDGRLIVRESSGGSNQ